jgi:hypothetical protein
LPLFGRVTESHFDKTSYSWFLFLRSFSNYQIVGTDEFANSLQAPTGTASARQWCKDPVFGGLP